MYRAILLACAALLPSTTRCQTCRDCPSAPESRHARSMTSSWLAAACLSMLHCTAARALPKCVRRCSSALASHARITATSCSDSGRGAMAWKAGVWRASSMAAMPGSVNEALRLSAPCRAAPATSAGNRTHQCHRRPGRYLEFAGGCKASCAAACVHAKLESSLHGSASYKC